MDELNNNDQNENISSQEEERLVDPEEEALKDKWYAQNNIQGHNQGCHHDDNCCPPPHHHCCIIGPTGPQGPQGPNGIPGPFGPTGPNKHGYGHIYNAVAGTVSIGTDFVFSNNGVLGTGVSFTPGNAVFTLNDTGTYFIRYYTEAALTGAVTGPYSILLNSTALGGLVTGSTVVANVLSPGISAQNSGAVMVDIATAPMDFTLRYSLGATDLSLTGNKVNAAVDIIQLL